MNQQRNYSLAEYFAIEEMSEIRYEYFDGAILAMSGSSLDHNRITQNLWHPFDALHDSGCRTFAIGVRLKTPGGLYTYPDVMVICGGAELTPDRLETVTNPVVIAEVLSESTRDYDRGQKFDLCSASPTLRDYVLVDQYAIDIEHRFFNGVRWESRRYTKREDVIQLTGVNFTLRVAGIYERGDFSPPPHHQ